MADGSGYGESFLRVARGPGQADLRADGDFVAAMEAAAQRVVEQSSVLLGRDYPINGSSRDVLAWYRGLGS